MIGRLVITTALLTATPVVAQTPAPQPSTRQEAFKAAADDLRAGRLDEAAGILREAADRFQSPQALLTLARIQSTRRDPQGALESLQRAVKLAPNSEEVLSAFAQMAIVARIPVPAIVTLDTLTRMCPTVAQYHYLLGVTLMQVGDMVSAVDALKAAEALEPDRALTLIALGLALNVRKSYDEARQFLARSLELEPDNVEAVAALAESEEGLGRDEEAGAHARRALGQVRGNATANLVVGLLSMKKQDYAGARDAFERVVATDPDSTRAYYQLSLACARLGNDECAQRSLALYREKLRETENRVLQLRTQTGLGRGGTRP